MNAQPQSAVRKVLFIGLGQIGIHLATHLKTDGADVIVSNRTFSKAAAWSDKLQGKYTQNPAEVISNCNVVITCVGDDKDLEAIFTTELLQELRPGTLVIDHTTASAKGARSLSQKIEARKANFVDAPVSGGSKGAEGRKLAIMVGANDEAIFNAAQSIMSSYAARIIHVGPVGAGQICKMANQLCIAGALEGVAEGIGLATAAGLDPHVVVSALTGGAAQSWQLENRSSFMIKKSFVAGFAARLMSKDLNLAIEEADRLKVHVPVGSAVLDQYKNLIDRDLGEEDFSNLFRLVLE